MNAALQDYLDLVRIGTEKPRRGCGARDLMESCFETGRRAQVESGGANGPIDDCLGRLRAPRISNTWRLDA